MSAGLRALALLTLVTGCAMQSASRAPAATTAAAPMREEAGRHTPGTTGGAGYAPAPAAATPTTPAPPPRTRDVEDGAPSPPAPPVTITTAQSVDTVAGGTPAGEELHRLQEVRIGAQVQRIRDEQIRLTTNPGVCREVCFAAGSICLAAQEVCHLAGDDDARCARARTACADAGRQRDGSCPVCPPTH